MILGRRKKAIALAIQSWRECHADRSDASLKANFESKCQVEGIDPSTTILLIKIAMEVWAFLRKLKEDKDHPDDKLAEMFGEIAAVSGAENGDLAS